MTDPENPNATTDQILKDLMKSVSSLTEDVAELRKRNEDTTAATTTKESRKQPCNGESSSNLRDLITREGENDPSQQYSSNEDSDSDPAGSTDTEDHTSSDVDRFSSL